jgi:hypothetical protein
VKISFHETGGFVPIARGCELDSTTMQPAEAAELSALVQTSDVLNMRDVQLPNAADVVRYSFTIERDDIHHSVKFDGPCLPDELRTLVAFCKARSQPLL